MNNFSKNKSFIILMSLFCLIYTLKPYNFIKKQPSNNIQTTYTKKENTSTKSKITDKKNKSNFIDTTIDIPNDIVFPLVTNYIKSSMDKKTPYDIYLTSSQDVIHAKLDMQIFKSNMLVNFDIKINSIKNNKLSIYISNLSIGNVKISNKIAKPLISNISNDNILVSNNKSNVELKIDLSNILEDSIIIDDISINEDKTNLKIRIKI